MVDLNSVYLNKYRNVFFSFLNIKVLVLEQVYFV